MTVKRGLNDLFPYGEPCTRGETFTDHQGIMSHSPEWDPDPPLALVTWVKVRYRKYLWSRHMTAARYVDREKFPLLYQALQNMEKYELLNSLNAVMGPKGFRRIDESELFLDVLTEAENYLRSLEEIDMATVHPSEYPLLFDELRNSNTPDKTLISGDLLGRLNDIMQPKGFRLIRGGDALERTLSEIETFLENEAVERLETALK